MGRDNQPKARQLARKDKKETRRASYARILIVTEGSKTEPLYFEDIRSAYQLHSANVAVQPGLLGTAPTRAIALTCHLRPRIFKQHSTMQKPVHTQQLAQAPCEPHPKGVYSRLLDDEHGNAHSDAVDELPLPGRRPSPCRLCASA